MAIKDYYDLSYIQRISGKMSDAYPDFPKDRFILAIQEQLAEQIYSEKMILISKNLHECFPSYSKALEVFTAVLGPKMHSMAEMYEAGMEYAPFGKYIELYAVQNEDCYEETISYIYEMTQRYSGEFAMRPLLAAFPERTLAVIQKWTEDESNCVRRLCSECMRISIPWGTKLKFALEHFDGYSDVLVKLATDECEYVRRSVANNLNELCKADIDKAQILIDKIRAIDSKYSKTVITHGTRWARKKEFFVQSAAPRCTYLAKKIPVLLRSFSFLLTNNHEYANDLRQRELEDLLARQMNENGLIEIVGRGAAKKYKLK